MITPVQKLYEVWAGDAELRDELGRSLDPRGTDWLFEVFAALGPGPGDLVLDAGARDAVHTIRLVRERGVHAVAVDPLAFLFALGQEPRLALLHLRRQGTELPTGLFVRRLRLRLQQPGVVGVEGFGEFREVGVKRHGRSSSIRCRGGREPPSGRHVGG